jgi:hypothetical protein
MLNSNHFNPEAEKAIIRELLDCHFFKISAINKRLANLPSGFHEARVEYICEILDGLLFPKRTQKFFGTFRNLDVFLTATGKRAHFIHTFEVFVLGFILISKIWHTSRKRNECFQGRSAKYIFNTWLLASSTHDLGRPLEISTKIARRLAELYKQYNLISTAEQFENVANINLAEKEISLTRAEINGSEVDIKQHIVSSISSVLAIEEDEALGLVDKMISTNNHGYMSAAILCQIWLKKLGDLTGIRDNIRLKEKYKYFSKSLFESMGAVSVHALDKTDDSLVGNIAIDNNPFAFILFIADNLQDWERPSVSDQKWPIYYLGDFAVVDDEKISLSYIAKYENWDDETKERIKEAFQNKINTIKSIMPSSPKIGFQIQLTLATDIMHYKKTETFVF